MRRSVRWHLLLNSLAVSLAAIIAVGLVTLVLVDAYFAREEEQYLRDRGDELVQPIETVLQWGGSEADLQQIVSIGLFTGHIRIRVLDHRERLLADSGTLGDLIPAEPVPSQDLLEGAFQFYVDEFGRLQGFSLPFSGPQSFQDLANADHLSVPTKPVFPALQPAPQPPIAELSEATVRLPLHVSNQIVAYAELSEGPAFGSVIRNSLQQALLLGGLVALVIAILASFVAARQVTRPLLALGSAANDMAAGDLEARAPASKLTEIDRLSGQFNDMADRLGATIASLEADRTALRRLIADASHELRTPITALVTFNELLARDGSAKDEPAATFISESGRQLAQLQRLTSDLLDLSRFEARLSGTDFVSGDIRPVAESAHNSLRSMSQAKEQQLQLILPDQEVLLLHDPAALEQAISNLVANAIWYTQAGGRIQVKLTDAREEATITVRDNGPGIPDEEQVEIFERFHRGQNTIGEGSGLGLSIAQEIAAIHGGRITLISQLGEGSAFFIHLPHDEQTV